MAYIDVYVATVYPALGRSCAPHHQHAPCFQALVELLGRNGQSLNHNQRKMAPSGL